jgi:hypothetical protein
MAKYSLAEISTLALTPARTSLILAPAFELTRADRHCWKPTFSIGFLARSSLTFFFTRLGSALVEVMAHLIAHLIVKYISND